MAWTRTETQITFAASNTTSVAAGATATSDKITANIDTVNAYIKCYAKNSGTPASGDVVDVDLQFGGDPDVDSTEEMDSIGGFMTTLDTNQADPAVRTIPQPFLPQGEDLQLFCNSTAASAITVGFTLVEEGWS